MHVEDGPVTAKDSRQKKPFFSVCSPRAADTRKSAGNDGGPMILVDTLNDSNFPVSGHEKEKTFSWPRIFEESCY